MSDLEVSGLVCDEKAVQTSSGGIEDHVDKIHGVFPAEVQLLEAGPVLDQPVHRAVEQHPHHLTGTHYPFTCGDRHRRGVVFLEELPSEVGKQVPVAGIPGSPFHLLGLLRGLEDRLTGLVDEDRNLDETSLPCFLER